MKSLCSAWILLSYALLGTLPTSDAFSGFKSISQPSFKVPTTKNSMQYVDQMASTRSSLIMFASKDGKSVEDIAEEAQAALRQAEKELAKTNGGKSLDAIADEAEETLRKAEEDLAKAEAESEGKIYVSPIKEEKKVESEPMIIPVAKESVVETPVVEPPVVEKETPAIVEPPKAEEEKPTVSAPPKAEEEKPTVSAPPKTPPSPPPPPVDKERIRSIQDQALAAAIGGTLIGLSGGIAIDVKANDQLFDLDIPLPIPPAVLGVLLGGGTYIASNMDNDASNVIRNTLGGATKGVGKAIKSVIKASIDSVVASVTAIPGNVATAVKKGVDEKVEEVKQIPVKVKDEVVQIPGKVSTAAKEAADSAQTAAKEAAIEAVEEIKATPGRVVEGTKKAIVDTVDNTKKGIIDTVDKTVDSVEKSVDQVVSYRGKKVDELKATIAPDAPPAPPKAPPTPPEPTAPPKQETKKQPSLSIPSIKIPEVKLPQVKMPEAPKISIPAPPKRPSTEAAKPKPPPKPPTKRPTLKIQPPKIAPPKVDKEAERKKEIAKKTAVAKAAAEAVQKEQAAAAKKAEAEAKRQAAAEAAAAKKAEAEAKRQAVAEAAAEKKAEAEAKRQAVAEAAAAKKAEAEAKRQAAAEATAAKKAEAEAKRQAVAEAAAAKKAEAEAKRQAAAEAAAAKKAEAVVEKAKPGQTISLFGIFGGNNDSDQKEAPLRPKPPQTRAPQRTQTSVKNAPKGVPTISNWEQNSDGSITGFIKGSFSFGEGEAVTTSPVSVKATGGSVIETASGSRYFLAPQDNIEVESRTDSLQQKREEAAAKREQAAEAKRQALAEAAAERQAAAEAKRQEAAAAAQARKEQLAAVAAERNAAAEAKRQAAAEAAAAKKEQAASAADAKRQAAEAKRQAAAAALKAKKEEAEAKKQEAEAKRKLANQEKTAEAAIKAAKPGQTISLFGIFGGNTEPKPATSAPPPKTPSKTTGLKRAPKGVPTIANWSQNRDGSISGFIQGSFSFGDGEAVTTSSIRGKAEGGSVVETASGSRYFLAPQANVPTVSKSDQLKQKREQAAAERQAAAEARRQAAAEAAQAKKEQAAAAASDRKAAAEAKRQSAAQARKEEAVAVAADRKAAAEAKRQALAEAAAARKQAAEANKAAATKEKKAEDSIKKAKPGQTISLFGFGGDKPKPAPKPPRTPPKSQKAQTGLKRAPKGVPTIANWSQNRDGSISGFIQGSFSFGDGEAVTTSSIRGKAEGGSVVETASGSRYFLDPGAASSSRAAKPKKAVVVKAKQAEKVLEKAKPGATISLFGFGKKDSDSGPKPQKPSTPPKKSNAPRGVPTISKWKQNRDGSISGFISGSPSFEEGEAITTSPITSNADSGKVVQTSSGSKYYLDETKSRGLFA